MCYLLTLSLLTYLLVTVGEDMTDGLTEEALESRYQVLSAQLPEAGDTDTNHLIDTTAASAQLSIGRPPPSPIHLVSSEQGQSCPLLWRTH